MPNRRQGRDGVDAFTIWKPVSGKTYLELVQGRDFADLKWFSPFTTGNPFLGTKLLGFSIGRGSGALKGLKAVRLAYSDGVFFFSLPLRPFFFAILFRFSLAGWQDRPRAPGGSEDQDSETEELVK